MLVSRLVLYSPNASLLFFVFFLTAQSSFPSSPSPSNVQMTTLAQRVKEVLPHVPLNIIQRDLGMVQGSSQSDRYRKSGLWQRGCTGNGHSAPLFPARTGCVDLTITNLLEGAVAFMPEDVTEGTQPLPTASAPKVRPRDNQGQDLGQVGAVSLLPLPDSLFDVETLAQCLSCKVGIDGCLMMMTSQAL